MSTDVEELLADAMRRQADQTAWTPPLLGRALQRHRHWRRRRRAVLAAGSASLAIAVVAASVAVVSERGAPTVTKAKAETVAYVLSRTTSAVTAASGDILEVRSHTRDGWSFATWYDPANGAIRLDVQPPAGRPTFYYAEPKQTVIVDYNAKAYWTWDTASLLRRIPASRRLQLRLRLQFGRYVQLVPAAIAAEMSSWSTGSLTAPTPATIRRELADGQFTLIGAQTVHGERLLELRGAYGLGRLGKGDLYLWVNAASYLPVRSIADKGLGVNSKPLYSEFSWLRPTATNLAALTPAIPAGFKHQTPLCQCG